MLSLKEIFDLIEALRKSHEFVDELRVEMPIATNIQYPKIPTILSESIACLCIQKGILLSGFEIGSVSRGGKVADILCTGAFENPLKIEVKASGQSNFATFGAKDYEADVLLWLLFNDLFRSRTSNVLEVLVCPNPITNLPWRKTRVTVSQLKKDWNGELVTKKLSLSQFEG